MTKRWALAAALGGLAILPAIGDAQTQVPSPSADAPYVPKPGEGVLCAWQTYNGLAESGRNCFDGDNPNPAAQKGLEEGAARLDAYVLANNPGMTQGDLDTLKQEQAGFGAPKDMMCSQQVGAIYTQMIARSPAQMKAEVDALIAKPGKPTMDGCLG